MSKLLGVGVDMCAVSRMEPLVDSRFLQRFFTPAEQAYIRGKGKTAAQSMAGLFAAKEAAVKALGCGICFPLTELEVLHSELGQPVLQLSGEALRRARGGQLLLSITHEGGMALALCLWQGDDAHAAPDTGCCGGEDDSPDPAPLH